MDDPVNARAEAACVNGLCGMFCRSSAYNIQSDFLLGKEREQYDPSLIADTDSAVYRTNPSFTMSDLFPMQNAWLGVLGVIASFSRSGIRPRPISQEPWLTAIPDSSREQHIRFETPKWMGIDEIHLIRPRGVITNIA